MTLLTKKILNDELFNDLTNFQLQDYRVNPDIFVTNYLYFSSFFSSDRVKLQVGNDKPTNPNLYINIVANSGQGKSYMNQFFYRPIMDIQIRENEKDNETDNFVNACLNYLNENETVTSEQKQNYTYGYNQKFNTHFDSFLTRKKTHHVFCVNDFSPESLTVKFNQSKNNTILLNCDEFEDLQNSVSRTKTVSNTFSFLTSFFEGKTELVTRKTQDDIIIKDAKLCVLANTVPQTLDKLKLSDFFNSGLGYRYLYYVNDSSNIEDPIIPKKNNNLISTYEVYQGKVSERIESFFYNMVYNSTDQVILKINSDSNLKVYGDLLLKLWNEFIKSNESLKNSQKETFKARLSTMFNKCILCTFLMNYSYNDKLIYPFNELELTENDIIRGYEVYHYFLNQMINIFSGDQKSDLTETEQTQIEFLETGQPVDLIAFKIEVVKNTSESTYKRLVRKKSNQFKIEMNNFSKKQQITRLF